MQVTIIYTSKLPNCCKVLVHSIHYIRDTINISYTRSEKMLIEKELICLDIDESNKQNIIDNLSEVAFQNEKINDLDAYRNTVYKREKEFSTALGYLVAVPHGQSDGVNEPFVVFGRCKKKILWDENEVKLIFMIGVPLQNRDRLHMKILANISRKLIDDTFRESLLSAQNQDEIFDILSQITI